MPTKNPWTSTPNGERRRRPDEERSEQGDARERSVAEQMTERPERNARRHRVSDRRLDPRPGHVGGCDQDEADHGEERGDMARPRGWHPYERGLGPRRAVAPDDHREGHERNHRIRELPGSLAEARDLPRPPIGCDDSDGMRGKEDDKAGEE